MRTTKNVRTISVIAYSILYAALLSVAPSIHAAFELNFKADNTGTMVTNMHRANSQPNWGHTAVMVDGNNQVAIGETVIHPTTFKVYKHFIIGDLNDGFIQEVYIEDTGGACFAQFCWDKVAAGGVHSLYGSNTDPLGSNVSLTGNATGNPSRVIVRQVLNDGQVHQEYIKKEFDKKAKVSQTITEAGVMQNHFEIDFSHIALNQFASPTKVTNTINFDDPTVQDFDMDNMATEGVDINAGKYIYIDGAGTGGSSGTYLYLDSSETVIDSAWSNYFDFTESNPWMDNTNKPKL